MWMTDQKRVRSLLILVIFGWSFLFAFASILYIAEVEWYVLLVFLAVYTLSAVISTLQFISYSKGIFVSDFEIILPGVTRKKFSSQDLEKIVLSDTRSRFGTNYFAMFYLKGKKLPYGVTFSSDEKRREIIELLCEFCPHVQLVDKTKRSEKRKK